MPITLVGSYVTEFQATMRVLLRVRGGTSTTATSSAAFTGGASNAFNNRILVVTGGTGAGTTYTTRLDEGVTYTYVGKAVAGSATSASVWQIARYPADYSAGLFANGATTFVSIWDNRASLSYSYPPHTAYNSMF